MARLRGSWRLSLAMAALSGNPTRLLQPETVLLTLRAASAALSVGARRPQRKPRQRAQTGPTVARLGVSSGCDAPGIQPTHYALAGFHDATPLSLRRPPHPA